MDMAVLATDTARGPLMPMPTMAAMAMAATAMAVLATDTARGPLMPMPTMVATAMAVMAMVDSDMATARGPLMLTTEATAMAVLATAMALMATASNLISKHKPYLQISNPDLNLLIGKCNSYHELNEFKYTQLL